jgi:hypothetical protein
MSTATRSKRGAAGSQIRGVCRNDSPELKLKGNHEVHLQKAMEGIVPNDILYWRSVDSQSRSIAGSAAS